MKNIFKIKPILFSVVASHNAAIISLLLIRRQEMFECGRFHGEVDLQQDAAIGLNEMLLWIWQNLKIDF